MILKLQFLGGTALARQYRHPNGVLQWVPRSVAKILSDGAGRPTPATPAQKAAAASVIHEVDVQDWWLKENPFIARVPKGQGQLL